jgi:hypothetical protein
MNTFIDSNKIGKDDAIDILDRTIGFVNNCDSKASVVLGVFGVLLTVLFTSEGITELKNIIKAAMNTSTRYGFLYIIFFSITAIGFTLGIIKLMQVLFPKTDCVELKQECIELNSNIFFQGICKNSTYKRYKDKLVNCTEDEYMNDIISQIYINSIICNRKYRNFKLGVLMSFIGFTSFLLIWGIGIIIY